jgi:hypothetical protein
MAQVFQRDDGLWSIGITDDAPGPFESRAFAEAVALQNLPRSSSDMPRHSLRPVLSSLRDRAAFHQRRGAST